MKQKKFLYIGSERNGKTTLEISLEVPYKVKHTPTPWPNSIFGTYSRKMKICDHKKTCVRTFIAALSNTKILKPPRRPPNCEWINCIISIQWDTTWQ